MECYSVCISVSDTGVIIQILVINAKRKHWQCHLQFVCIVIKQNHTCVKTLENIYKYITPYFFFFFFFFFFILYRDFLRKWENEQKKIFFFFFSTNKLQIIAKWHTSITKNRNKIKCFALLEELFETSLADNAIISAHLRQSITADITDHSITCRSM